MTSRSSPPWPTSAATATTSAFVSSAIQPIATEVSSPPEYARTTRSVMTVALRSVGGGSYAGQPAQPIGEGIAAGGVARDDEDGVVAGDCAEDLRQRRTVQRGGQKMRAPRGGAGDDEVDPRLDADQQVGGQPGDP